MTVGEIIGGYTVLENFRVVGAGLSEWTFAERDGREYFLKRFLAPTYPDDAAPGSDRTKARKRARCAAFESHHRGIMAALAPVTRYGGNLVATLDFFRHGAKYYKVTEKIDVAGLDSGQVARLDPATKMVLFKTVAHSLKILHDLEIVHSDLKPSNVLIKRTELGHTTKLIDFDSSYVVGSPPPTEDIVGTMNYYSPELIRYIQGEAAATELTPASDIFALGLIYAEYLTGSMPAADPPQRSAAVAVLNGQQLKIGVTAADPGAREVHELVEKMLMLDPAARPSIGEVHATLMGIGKPKPTTAKRPGPPAPPPPLTPATARAVTASPPSAEPSRLRGSGLRIAAGLRRSVAPSGGTPTGKLGGRLLGRFGKGGAR